MVSIVNAGESIFLLNPFACDFFRRRENSYLGIEGSWKEGVNNPIPYIRDVHKILRQWRGAEGIEYANR